MPSKKKKFSARFPPARIKKIMQTDEEVGKVNKTLIQIEKTYLEVGSVKPTFIVQDIGLFA